MSELKYGGDLEGKNDNKFPNDLGFTRNDESIRTDVKLYMYTGQSDHWRILGDLHL